MFEEFRQKSIKVCHSGGGKAIKNSRTPSGVLPSPCRRFRSSTLLVRHIQGQQPPGASEQTFGSSSAAQVILLNYWNRAHEMDNAGGKCKKWSKCVKALTFRRRLLLFLLRSFHSLVVKPHTCNDQSGKTKRSTGFLLGTLLMYLGFNTLN